MPVRSLAQQSLLPTESSREQQRSSAGPETPVIAKSEAKKAQRSAAQPSPMAEDLVRKLEAEVQHESTASTYAILVVKRAREQDSERKRECENKKESETERENPSSVFVNTTRLLTIYRIVPRDCCETARVSERERARESGRERAGERESEQHPSMPSLLSSSPSSSSFK